MDTFAGAQTTPFVEPSTHLMAVSPMASWFEYLAIAGAVLTERLLPVDGTVTARGPGSSWVGTSMRSRATPSRDGATKKCPRRSADGDSRSC
jgi:hypothetical protein